MSPTYIPECPHGTKMQAICPHAGNALCTCCASCRWECFLALQYAPISADELQRYRLSPAFKSNRL